jgi:hypothetical protein
MESSLRRSSERLESCLSDLASMDKIHPDQMLLFDRF